MPAKVLGITTGNRGEQITPYAQEIVEYDTPKEDWLFTEDMPQKRPAKQ